MGWDWEFGDGATARGPTVEHSYAKPGTYVAALRLRTEAGVSACSEATARHSIVANAPPVADAGADRKAAVDEELLFDGPARMTKMAGRQLRVGFRRRHNRQRGQRASPLSRQRPLSGQSNGDRRHGAPNSTVSDTAVVAVNQPPQPVIAAPAAACPGEALAFGGGGSHDDDGKLDGFFGASATGKRRTAWM